MGCTGAVLVLSGLLRVYIASEEGREVTLFRIHAGEPCVLSASCLLDAIQFDLVIEAAEDVPEMNFGTAFVRLLAAALDFRDKTA